MTQWLSRVLLTIRGPRLPMDSVNVAHHQHLHKHITFYQVQTPHRVPLASFKANMHFTNALFTTLSLLSLASASPVAKTLSPAPRSPLERRAPDCTQDDDHLKCVCEACDETEDFKVAFRELFTEL